MSKGSEYRSKHSLKYTFIKISTLICFGMLMLLIGRAWDVQENVLNGKLYRPPQIQKQPTRLETYQLPLTFIGGSLRSGTTLLRVMLDAHPDIRCGPETLIFPHFLEFLENYMLEMKSGLVEAGLAHQNVTVGKFSVLDNAVRSFMLEIILNFDKPAKHYCNKDPCNLLYLKYIEHLFPNAKFILMVRDLRAVAYSYVVNDLFHLQPNVKPRYDLALKSLNELYEHMLSQCLVSSRCFIQKYEDLVLQPIRETKNIFKFLEIDWTEDILHHENHMNDTTTNSAVPIPSPPDMLRLPFHVSLSLAMPFFRGELSSEQVKRGINLEGLSKWKGKIPDEYLKKIHEFAPVMEKLGYDMNDNNPIYGEADDFTLKKGKWKESKLENETVP